MALNPLHTTGMSNVGMMLAYAGEWDRGVEIVEHAMDLNPHHPGWVHYILATNHYRKGEFEQALVQAKRSTMTHVVWTPLCVAVAAGQLGLAADARAAIDVIRTHHPAYLDAAEVRALWSKWQWDAGLVDRLLDGFGKAITLAGSSRG
jgi:adenylate cyclase